MSINKAETLYNMPPANVRPRLFAPHPHQLKIVASRAQIVCGIVSVIAIPVPIASGAPSDTEALIVVAIYQNMYIVYAVPKHALIIKTFDRFMLFASLLDVSANSFQEDFCFCDLSHYGTS